MEAKDKSKRAEIKRGDHVIVPSTPGHISNLNQSGVVSVVNPPYCKVLIKYGGRKGIWAGKIEDLEWVEHRA